MKYLVTFEKYYTYEVDANNFDEAEKKAYEEFKVNNTNYDHVEVCLNEKFEQFIVT